MLLIAYWNDAVPISALSGRVSDLDQQTLHVGKSNHENAAVEHFSGLPAPPVLNTRQHSLAVRYGIIEYIVSTKLRLDIRAAPHVIECVFAHWCCQESACTPDAARSYRAGTAPGTDWSHQQVLRQHSWCCIGAHRCKTTSKYNIAYLFYVLYNQPEIFPVELISRLFYT